MVDHLHVTIERVYFDGRRSLWLHDVRGEKREESGKAHIGTV